MSGLPESIIIDCSHGNSNKQPQLQPLVVENVAGQLVAGNRSIIGDYAGEQFASRGVSQSQKTSASCSMVFR